MKQASRWLVAGPRERTCFNIYCPVKMCLFLLCGLATPKESRLSGSFFAECPCDGNLSNFNVQVSYIRTVRSGIWLCRFRSGRPAVVNPFRFHGRDNRTMKCLGTNEYSNDLMSTVGNRY
eukprot:g684.t1